MRLSLFLLVLSFFVQNVFAQNLMEERIRKIGGAKKGVYFEKGIFHNGKTFKETNLKAIRHSYSSKTSSERVVLDFETNQVPRIYGYMTGAQKRIYLDLFDTKIKKEVSSFGTSHFVENIDFFDTSKESLSLEISLKESVSAEVFYLETPGRLVIDLKK